MPSPLSQRFDISETRLKEIVSQTIAGADDGELYLESSESEALMFDNGRLKTGELQHRPGVRPARGGRARRRAMRMRASFRKQRCCAPQTRCRR